ncbi:hypothetical protein ACFLZX_04005 [Nanoarchaeota archaeon]
MHTSKSGLVLFLISFSLFAYGCCEVGDTRCNTATNYGFCCEQGQVCVDEPCGCCPVGMECVDAVCDFPEPEPGECGPCYIEGTLADCSESDFECECHFDGYISWWTREGPCNYVHSSGFEYIGKQSRGIVIPCGFDGCEETDLGCQCEGEICPEEGTHIAGTKPDGTILCCPEDQVQDPEYMWDCIDQVCGSDTVPCSGAPNGCCPSGKICVDERECMDEDPSNYAIKWVCGQSSPNAGDAYYYTSNSAQPFNGNLNCLNLYFHTGVSYDGGVVKNCGVGGCPGVNGQECKSGECWELGWGENEIWYSLNGPCGETSCKKCVDNPAGCSEGRYQIHTTW